MENIINVYIQTKSDKHCFFYELYIFDKNCRSRIIMLWYDVITGWCLPDIMSRGARCLSPLYLISISLPLMLIFYWIRSYFSIKRIIMLLLLTKTTTRYKYEHYCNNNDKDPEYHLKIKLVIAVFIELIFTNACNLHLSILCIIWYSCTLLLKSWYALSFLYLVFAQVLSLSTFLVLGFFV